MLNSGLAKTSSRWPPRSRWARCASSAKSGFARSERRLSALGSCRTRKAHGSWCTAVGARTAARSSARTVARSTGSGAYDRTERLAWIASSTDICTLVVAMVLSWCNHGAIEDGHRFTELSAPRSDAPGAATPPCGAEASGPARKRPRRAWPASGRAPRETTPAMPHEGPAPDTAIPRRALLAAGLALLGGALPVVREARGQDSGARPRTVKALYLSYHGVGDRTIRGRVLDLLD